METLIFRKMNDDDIVKSIQNITKDASVLKSAIFKANILKKDISKQVFDTYLAAVNDFLRFWDEYAEDLSNKIKVAKGSENVVTISYDRVKDFVYAKYDYASILPFTDGILQGVKDGKFKTKDDIDDFRDHTVSKAFRDCQESSASVLDSVLTRSGSIGSYEKPQPATMFDAKMFDSLKRANIFNRRDRAELYKAISKVVDFMGIDLGVGKYLTTKDISIFVSMINNVVDYMTYSLTVYACRIYIISSYAYPFIENSLPVNESTSLEESDVTSPSDITIFRDIDETICRDPAKTREFINTFAEFITLIGADPLFGNSKPEYNTSSIEDSRLEDNEFCRKLLVNPIHEFLTKRQFAYTCKDNLYSTMDDLKVVLHELIYNSSQAIQGESSPKQEMFHVIRGMTCDQTLKGYQGLAKDLYLCAFQLCGQLDSFIDNLVRWKKNESEHPNHNTSALNNASECLKVAAEFYRDLSTTILLKARDIEMHVNELRSKEADRVIKGISMKVPDIKSDIDSNVNMMTAVPDTTRMPTELLDLYDIPTFESLMLYDEYIRNLPFMEGDIYYSEAFNLSTIIDKILASIRAAWQRFQRFYNDKRVQTSIEWIIKHEQELMSMDFSSANMKALKHKVNIGFPAGFENLHKGLSGFKMDNIKTREELDKYIKSLYPNGVYEWFADPNNKDGKVGAAKYRNYILFYDMNEVKETSPQEVPFDGSQIQRAVPEWIKTVKTVKAALDGYVAKGKELESDVTKIKSQLANITNTQNSGSPASSQPTPPAPPATTGNTTQTPAEPKTDQNPNGSGNTSSNKASESATNANAALVDIQLAVDRIYRSLSQIFIEYIFTTYGYLTSLYSMGTKK